MQVIDRINAIEARGAKLHLSLWKLCRLAGVDYSSVARWRNGGDPLHSSFETAAGKLDAKLDEVELELFAQLSEKFANERAEARTRAA